MEEIRRYLNGRGRGYLYRFKKLMNGKRIFNFAAALYGPLWFAYRLMWREALAVWLFSMGLSAAVYFSIFHLMALPNTLEIFKAVIFILSIIAAIIVGMTADIIYLHSIKSELRKDKQDEILLKKQFGKTSFNQKGISCNNVLAMTGIMVIVWKLVPMAQYGYVVNAFICFFVEVFL